jgi:hypothetical protein
MASSIAPKMSICSPNQLSLTVLKNSSTSLEIISRDYDRAIIASASKLAVLGFTQAHLSPIP